MLAEYLSGIIMPLVDVDMGTQQTIFRLIGEVSMDVFRAKNVKFVELKERADPSSNSRS